MCNILAHIFTIMAGIEVLPILIQAKCKNNAAATLYLMRYTRLIRTTSD